MAEFDKFWEQYAQGDRTYAEKVWHAAQMAALRTIRNPPCVPIVGDKIRILSLCHSKTLGTVREVTRINYDGPHWFI